MSRDSNILVSVFLGATESRNLEFKEGFGWESQKSIKLRDELIKAILAMGNTPGGGRIILGIRCDTKKKEIYPEGFSEKDAKSFIKNEEHIKKAVHGYCQRPVDFSIQVESYPKNNQSKFVIIQVQEFSKWPTVTTKPSKTKEENKKTPVIEHHAIYTRSKLAQWSSIKAGPQEIEDIIEIAVKKYNTHVQSLGYTKSKLANRELRNWLSNHQAQASKGLKSLGIQAHMEVQAKPLSVGLDFKKIDLKNAARESTIPTFGWPIGVFLGNREEYAPKIDLDGIHAEIPIKKHQLDGSSTYDYWAIHTSGAFYLLKSLFEDTRDPEQIFFNTRIVRITEVFMYLKNLYGRFDVPVNSEVEITIKHSGLEGRVLGSSSPNRLLLRSYKTNTDEVPVTIQTSLTEIDSNIVDLVEKFTKPLFEQFDAFEPNRQVLEEIVVSYLNGKVV